MVLRAPRRFWPLGLQRSDRLRHKLCKREQSPIRSLGHWRLGLSGCAGSGQHFARSGISNTLGMGSCQSLPMNHLLCAHLHGHWNLLKVLCQAPSGFSRSQVSNLNTPIAKHDRSRPPPVKEPVRVGQPSPRSGAPPKAQGRDKRYFNTNTCSWTLVPSHSDIIGHSAAPYKSLPFLRPAPHPLPPSPESDRFSHNRSHGRTQLEEYPRGYYLRLAEEATGTLGAAGNGHPSFATVIVKAILIVPH